LRSERKREKVSPIEYRQQLAPHGPGWPGLRALELEEYGYEGEIQLVETPTQPGCTASPYVRSNPDSTTKDNLENTGEGQSKGAANAWSLTRKGR